MQHEQAGAAPANAADLVIRWGHLSNYTDNQITGPATVVYMATAVNSLCPEWTKYGHPLLMPGLFLNVIHIRLEQNSVQ